MAKPITLLTGEPFLVDQELHKWMNAFTSKFGPESIFVFKEHPLPVSQIIATMTGGGLFASKSCIIIHGLPLAADDKKSSKEKDDLDAFIGWFVSHYRDMSSDTIILFVSYKPDKRGKLYKLFEQATSDDSLGIIERVVDQGTIATMVSQELQEYCTASQCTMLSNLLQGRSLYAAWYEIMKIRDYCAYHHMTGSVGQISDLTHTISDIVVTHVEQDSFAVIDTIVYKNYEEALSLIDRLQQVDNNPYAFLGGLYWGLRGVLMIVNAMNHGVTQSSQLISLTKLPPFTISRIMKQYSYLRPKYNSLAQLFLKLVDLEGAIKSGAIPVEVFWPQVKVAVVQYAAI